MSRRIAVLVMILLAAPLVAQSPSSPPRLQVPFQQFKLPNGLNVILHQDKTVPVATVNIWYHVGSANEKPGRTGFAHLFEHLMFEGSKHVKEGQFDTLLESAGAVNNASTSNDRTNYFIDVPVNALDLALFLDSDRMGFLLDAMPPEQVNSQRDVVKNERRQSYENRPYGMASLEIDKMLWPAGHPYSWPTIGEMEDLTAATQEDVVAFFKTYYAPNNAILVIAGDVEPEEVRRLAETTYGKIEPNGALIGRLRPKEPPRYAPVKVTLEDARAGRTTVQRYYLAPSYASAAPGEMRRRFEVRTRSPSPSPRRICTAFAVRVPISTGRSSARRPSRWWSLEFPPRFGRRSTRRSSGMPSTSASPSSPRANRRPSTWTSWR